MAECVRADTARSPIPTREVVMAGMGPPPKDPEKRARRNKPLYHAVLPADGRKGRAPAWPLPEDLFLKADLKAEKEKVKDLLSMLDMDLTARQRAKANSDLGRARKRVALLEGQLREWRKMEVALWRDLWKTPQAVEWERLGWLREVAQYVRWKVRAELGDLEASKEARQLADRLGLTPLAMLRLGWKVEEAVEEPTSDQKSDPYQGLYLVQGAVAGQ